MKHNSGYSAYCKNRKDKLFRRPDYPVFSDSWVPSMAVGAVLGLVVGIWQNFFPLPENLFHTIGAVMFTICFGMGGVACGLICAPLLHLGRRLFVKAKHHSALSAINKRLAENPVVKEILQYVRANNICSVVITARHIRLYDRIPDERYCDNQTDPIQCKGAYDAGNKKDQYLKPEHWAAYDRYCNREIQFCDIGYENMDDDTQMCLANYLREQLGNWGVATHRAYTVYTKTSGGEFTGEFTYNPYTGTVSANRSSCYIGDVECDIYHDIFVYNLEVSYAMSEKRRKMISTVLKNSKW